MLRRGAASPPPRASGAWRASSAPFPRRAGVRRRGAPPSAHRRQWHILFTCCQHVFLLFTCTLAWAGCTHAAHIPRIYSSMVHMRCTFLLAGDGEVRYGGVRAVRCGRVRIVRQGVEMQVGQPVHVHRMHVQCTRAAYPRSGQGRCRCVVDLTASTHAAGWRARCGAGGSRSARAARSARG